MLYTLAFLIHLEINLFEIFLNSSSRMPLGAMQCSTNWLKHIISEEKIKIYANQISSLVFSQMVGWIDWK